MKIQKQIFAPVLRMPGSQRLEQAPDISKPLLSSVFTPKCLSELRLGKKGKTWRIKEREKSAVFGDNAMRNLQEDSDGVTLPLQNISQDEDRANSRKY